MAQLAGIPILLYHRIVADRRSVGKLGWRSRKYVLTADVFKRQVQLLSQEKIKSSSLADLFAGRAGGTDASVIITFDDGNKSDYLFAYPLLAGLGLRGEFFITTNLVGKEGYLDWNDILEMHRGGMRFQSHAADHIDLRQQAEPALRRQLEVSKRVLEDKLGAEVSFLALPYGLFNRRVLKMAQTVGYRGVCSSRYWPAKPCSPLMGRVAVQWETSLWSFRKMVQKDPFFYLTVRGWRALWGRASTLARRLVPGYLEPSRSHSSVA